MNELIIKQNSLSSEELEHWLIEKYEEHNKEIDDLEKQIRALKGLKLRLNIENKAIKKENKSLKIILSETNDYKSRCKKAIKYLENSNIKTIESDVGIIFYTWKREEVIEILRGVDK